MTRNHLLGLTLASLLMAGAATAGVTDVSGSSSWISAAEETFLLFTGEGEPVEATINTPIVSGDRLESLDGRLEVILADGNALRLDRGARLSFESLAGTAGLKDRTTALRLEKGAISLEVRQSTDWQPLRVETYGVVVELFETGLYRIEFDGEDATIVSVNEGEARVTTWESREVLRSGEWAIVEDEGRIFLARRSWSEDRFDGWVAARIARRLESRASSQYTEGGFSDSAAELDEYGSWYAWEGGWVWRPRVSFSWHPYSSGYWYWTPGGYCWVSSDPWGWAPYHYGSWVYTASWGWCWSPGWWYRSSWVYWWVGPGWIGWCPTGYYDGYYGHHWRGRHGGDFLYFDVSARVGLGDLDRRGWSFVADNTFGRRDLRDHLLRPDRIGGSLVGVVSADPLRSDRDGRIPGAGLAQELRDRSDRLLRETPQADDSLRSFLRRERDVRRDDLGDLRPVVADRSGGLDRDRYGGGIGRDRDGGDRPGRGERSPVTGDRGGSDRPIARDPIRPDSRRPDREADRPPVTRDPARPDSRGDRTDRPPISREPVGPRTGSPDRPSARPPIAREPVRPSTPQPGRVDPAPSTRPPVRPKADRPSPSRPPEAGSSRGDDSSRPPTTSRDARPAPRAPSASSRGSSSSNARSRPAPTKPTASGGTSSGSSRTPRARPSSPPAKPSTSAGSRSSRPSVSSQGSSSSSRKPGSRRP